MINTSWCRFAKRAFLFQYFLTLAGLQASSLLPRSLADSLPWISKGDVEAIRSHSPSGSSTSPDGKSIAYRIDGDLFVLELDGQHNEPVRLRVERRAAQDYFWSPDSRFLAFDIDPDDDIKRQFGNEVKQWATWDRQLKSIKVFSGVGRGRSGGFSPVQWASDHRLVFFATPPQTSISPAQSFDKKKLAQDGDGRADVVIRSTSSANAFFRMPKAKNELELGGKSQETGDRRDRFLNPEIVALHLLTGKVSTILGIREELRPNMSFRVSGNGNRLVAFHPSRGIVVVRIPSSEKAQPLRAKASVASPSQNDGWVCEPTDILLEVRDVLQEHMFMTLSPTGAFVAYFDSAGDVVIFDVATGKRTNLTKNVSLAESRLRTRRNGVDGLSRALVRFEDKLMLSYPDRPGEGLPVWTTNEASLICLGEGDLWIIDIATHTARNITRSIRGVISNVLNRRPDSSVNEADVIVAATSPKTAVVSLHRINTKSGATDVVGTLEGAPHHLNVSQPTGRLTFVREAFDTPPELFVTDLKTWAPRSLIQYSGRRNEFHYPKPVVISYQTRYGGSVSGVLYLPANITPDGKPPVIMTGYPEVADYLCGDRSLFPFRFQTMPPNIPDLTLALDRGYAVFDADIAICRRGIYGKHGPAQEITDAVLASLDALTATGLVDPARVGLWGYSYGGYMVNCVVTKTNRFRAGVCGAPVTDMLANAFIKDIGLSHFDRMADHQLRMGALLWDDTKRYVDNSPVFFVKDVVTPICLIVGDDDPLRREAMEMYLGLEYFNKPATLLVLKGKHHGSTAPFAWKMAIDFFDVHLQNKVAKAPFTGRSK